MQKICPTHNHEVLTACFKRGCRHYFLCRACFRSHPIDHDPNTDMKDIMYLKDHEDWILENEEIRNTEKEEIEKIYLQKKETLERNEQLLTEGMVKIKTTLQERHNLWMEELHTLMNSNQADVQEVFLKLEEDLNILKNINFREENIYEKVAQAKVFHDDVLPHVKESIEKAQNALKLWKMDENKMEACRNELIEILQDIHLKSFFTSGSFKSLRIPGKLAKLEEEHESLSRQIQMSQSERMELQSQLKEGQHSKSNLQTQVQSLLAENERLRFDNDRLTESNRDLHNQVNGLTETNQSLAEQITRLGNAISALNNENTSLKAQVAKLTVTNDQLMLNSSNLTSMNKELKTRVTELEGPRITLSEESRIINTAHLMKLDEWIPRPMTVHYLRKCKLTLLYRGTKHGFSAQAFSTRCGVSAPTITFIKSKEAGKIFGGFTTKTWSPINSYVKDEDAFLFSLTYGEKYPCKQPQFGIYTHTNNMTTFGGGHDIFISDGCNTDKTKAFTNFPTSFQCQQFSSTNDPNAKSYLAGSHHFIVEEIEVFHVSWP